VELPDPKQLGPYGLALQAALEMVSPIIFGWLLDYYFDWSPWGVIVGVIFGFVGGLAHLIAQVTRRGPDEPKPGQ
jgi:F0F1-type ATP synthase assembly protein I